VDNVFAELDDGFDKACLADAWLIKLVSTPQGPDVETYAPLRPATIILNLPNLFPLCVKGLRDGILILGMMSSG
jgi:hypothetical protein